MRQDKEFRTQHQKEYLVNQFIINNGYLSAHNPILIDDPDYQVKGIDLSCLNVYHQPVYIDFKLKNSNNFYKSETWSVELLRYTGYNMIDGWFISKNQMTTQYCFLEADSTSRSWDDIDSVDIIRVKKQMLKSKIELTTKTTLDDIIKMAKTMMINNLEDCLNSSGYYKQRIYLSDELWLTMSMPDAGRPVINLCFNKNYLNDISKKTTIR